MKLRPTIPMAPMAPALALDEMWIFASLANSKEVQVLAPVSFVYAIHSYYRRESFVVSSLDRAVVYLSYDGNEIMYHSDLEGVWPKTFEALDLMRKDMVNMATAVLMDRIQASMQAEQGTEAATASYPPNLPASVPSESVLPVEEPAPPVVESPPVDKLAEPVLPVAEPVPLVVESLPVDKPAEPVLPVVETLTVVSAEVSESDTVSGHASNN